MSRVKLQAPRICCKCGGVLEIGKQVEVKKIENGYLFMHKLHDPECKKVVKS